MSTNDEKLIEEIKEIWCKGCIPHYMPEKVAQDIIAKVREADTPKQISTPLGGLRVKDPSKCECEGFTGCGCAFGQCAKGLVF